MPLCVAARPMSGIPHRLARGAPQCARHLQRRRRLRISYRPLDRPPVPASGDAMTLLVSRRGAWHPRARMRCTADLQERSRSVGHVTQRPRRLKVRAGGRKRFRHRTGAPFSEEDRLGSIAKEISPRCGDERDLKWCKAYTPRNGRHERSVSFPMGPRPCGRLVTWMPRWRMSNGDAHPSPRSTAVQDNPGVGQRGIRDHRMRASYQPVDRRWSLTATPRASKRCLAISVAL